MGQYNWNLCSQHKLDILIYFYNSINIDVLVHNIYVKMLIHFGKTSCFDTKYMVCTNYGVKMVIYSEVPRHDMYIKSRLSSPITGLDRPRGFLEVKASRFRDNSTA